MTASPPPAVDGLLPPGTPVDLETCDREPIHLIGGVQPHGALLAVEGPELRVTRASANAAERLGVSDGVSPGGRALLGRPLGEVVGAGPAAALAAAGAEAAADDAARAYHPVAVEVAGRAFEVVVHRGADGGLLLEFEPAPGEALGVAAFHATVRRTMAAVARGTSVRAAAAAVADEVRRVTGFDRVWVYRFHEDWHGEIIAESRADAVAESWLDLHYPAADIPAQARALFLRHWLRLIVDVHAEPSSVLGDGGGPLDLSDCVLRAVSPVHLEYLRNMGVRASMSVSLVRDGALWGLVSCHHYAGPRRVSYDVRAACELLAQAFSTQLGLLEATEDREYALRLGAVRAALLERMAGAGDVVDGLLAAPGLLLELTGAEGAALCLGDGECATVGRTPGAAEVRALAAWLAAGRDASDADTFVSDNLGAAFPPAAAYADAASGVLAVALSRVRPYYVLWFRPQAAQTMRWGGDPADKPVRVGADGVARLTPRGSFAAWEEGVRGRSRPWRRAEVEAARALRGTVVDALLTRADELAALNRALEQSNRELDDFAYVASHDLKEPLRGIHNYAAMVSEDYAGVPLDADGVARLDTIRRLTTRLDGLIDSLLDHARVNRLALDVEPVDAGEALADALDRLAESVRTRGATVRVPRPLPAVRADRERLVEVFANLVSNAVKYGGPTPEVEVGALDAPDAPDASPILYVRDRGIGIEPRHHATVFRLFKRLHPRDAYGGGSGAGLTIVQKIVERHGGRVWLESAPGQGTTFYFTLGPAAPAVTSDVAPHAGPEPTPPAR
ncbi:histidine kinase [Gemmatimonadetes bacterium T265]|nr:histidine kinase [Gemmatimonadetes bacterium T265]